MFSSLKSESKTTAAAYQQFIASNFFIVMPHEVCELIVSIFRVVSYINQRFGALKSIWYYRKELNDFTKLQEII